jgi:4-carboxymuconolactone decarboxylase
VQQAAGQVEAAAHAAGVATAAAIDPVVHAQQLDQLGDAALPQAAIEALRGGRYDDVALADDERDAVAVALAALALRSVPGDLQERVIERWGVEGLLELSVLAGIYRMIAGYLASIEVPLPADGRDPWGPDPGPGLGGA